MSNNKVKKTHIVLPLDTFYRLVDMADVQAKNYLIGSQMINVEEHNGLLKSVMADINEALTGEWDCSNIEDNDVRGGFKLMQRQLKKSLIKAK